MKENNLPLKSCSHIINGSWLVCHTNNQVIRMHSSLLGKQTVYIDQEEIGSFRNMKPSFDYDFKKNGHNYSIKMKTESLAKTENVFTFHRDQSIVKVFKSSFKFTAKQISIILVPIVIITIISTIMEAPTVWQYISVFIWLAIAILITGKNYLQITESDNPNFE